MFLFEHYKTLSRLLFLMDAERAHNFSLKSLNYLNQLKLMPQVNPNTHAVKAFGLTFPNPVGLAAGLDKNGDYIDALARLGFGFIEIGTVTPKAQAGNPQPRLFRLPNDSILNRMGFNNQGVEAMIKNIKASNWVKQGGILGVNIGKNAVTPIENALDDYIYCLEHVYKYASYITVNISSPNTQNLRQLQQADHLEPLLAGLKHKQQHLTEKYGRYVPVLLKVAPDLLGDEIMTIASLVLQYEFDGLITTNTTSDKSNLDTPWQQQAGGASGKCLTQKADAILEAFASVVDGKIPLIGVGGISKPEDAQRKLDLGASLVQIYSGLIYEGPSLVENCVKKLI